MISEEAMQRMKAKVQQRVGATPPGTWAKVGVGVLVGGVAIGWIAFPYVLDKVVASQINLAQGRDSRRLWVQLPTLTCNLYVFNVTNPTEVMRGAKPIVQEIGPYCYKEVKDKTDFVEDPTTDTISYSARSTWYEDQRSPSCPAPHLTGDEVVTVPNIPILSVLLIAEKDFPAPFMTLVNQALPAIFGRFNDLFMRVTARSLLFDGILINCTATALYPRAVCIALKQNSRALKKISENVYTFSFFGVKNHTPEEFRYTVKRGTVDGQEIGRLVALDGKPELPFWRGECNKIQGTDASVFPPFRKMENGSLVAYSSEACRVIFGVYDGEYLYKGVKGYVYTAFPFGDTENNPGDRCYCPADDRCRKKGVLDALKCQGAPVVASHPHFYQASQQYLDGVIGLKPEKEKHEIRIVLEPISGTPLVARKRIQFNIELKPIRFIPLTQRLRRSLVPLFWAEETLDLDGNLMGLLEASLFRPIRAVDVIKWLCVVGGIGLGVLGIVLKIRKHRRDKVHTFDGEAGKEFGYEINPKSALKPEKIEGDVEVIDPFYINTEKNDQPFGKIMNGLHVAIPNKSASTMATPNTSRPASLANLEVKQLFSNEIQGPDIDKTSPLKALEDNKTPLAIPLDNAKHNTLENGNMSNNSIVDINLGNEMNYSDTDNLKNSPTAIQYPSPKNSITSLEHQMSFKTPTYSNNNVALTYTEPLNKLQIPAHTNESVIINSDGKFKEPYHTIISLGNQETNPDFKLNQRTDFKTMTNNRSGTEENLFGELTDISIGGTQSVNKSPDKVKNESTFITNGKLMNISGQEANSHQVTSQPAVPELATLQVTDRHSFADSNQAAQSNQIADRHQVADSHQIADNNQATSRAQDADSVQVADSHQVADSNQAASRDQVPGVQKIFSEENQPSEEEIKAVEEDINKLMAEMAELLPRKKSSH